MVESDKTPVTTHLIKYLILPDILKTQRTGKGFPGGSDGKVSACNVGDPGSIPGLGSYRRKWQPTPVFLPGKSYGLKSKDVSEMEEEEATVETKQRKLKSQEECAEINSWECDSHSVMLYSL